MRPDVDLTKPLHFLIVVIVIVAVSGIAGALVGQVATSPASGDITQQANSGFVVTFKSVSAIPNQPFVDNNTVQAQNGTLNSTGSAEVSLPGGIETSGNLSINVQSSLTQVTVATTDKNTIGFEGDYNSLELKKGTAANDGKADLVYDANSGTVSNISVDGLAAGQSFTLVDLDTDEVVGVAQSSPTGNVTFVNVESGSHRVAIQDFVIEVRDVNTNELISNATAEVRLFQEDTDTVFVRNSQNGLIGTSDLPADAAFAITAKAPGFVERQTFIESARQQQEIFLLNNSTDTRLTRLNVEDRTGDFQDEVRIQIERGVNTSDSSTDEEVQQIVAGDIVGSQLQFETELEEDVRYRVSVANGQGQERELGSFFVKTDRAINLVISGIDAGFEAPEDATVINATQSVNSTSGDKTVRAVVTDDSVSTTNLKLEVVNAADETDVLASTTAQGPIEQFSFSQTFTGQNAEKRLVARVTFDRGGETTTRTVPFGGEQFEFFPGLDTDYGVIFGVGFLMVLGGVFSVANARIGAVLIPGVALLLNLGGVIDTVVTTGAVGFAFAIAVGINIIRSSNSSLR
jgi:hypothetical protein